MSAGFVYRMPTDAEIEGVARALYKATRPPSMHGVMQFGRAWNTDPEFRAMWQAIAVASLDLTNGIRLRS